MSPRAAQWLDSGPLDVEFYAALRGREFASPEEAARDFVDHGMPARLSPHPLLDFLSLPPDVRRPWRNGRVAKVLGWFEDRGGAVGPLAAHPDPDAARAAMIRSARRLAQEEAGPRTGAPHIGWRPRGVPSREQGLTTVLVVAAGVKQTSRAVETLLERAEAAPVEVLVVDVGSPRHVALGLQAALLARDRVEVVRFPASVSTTAAADLVIDRSAGDCVVLLAPDMVVRQGGCDRTVALLADPAVAAVQPVVLDATDLISSVGSIADAAGRRTPVMREHPPEDALRLDGERLDGISHEMVALRAEDVSAVGGLTVDRPLPEAVAGLLDAIAQRRSGGFRVDPLTLVSRPGLVGTDTLLHHPVDDRGSTFVRPADPDGDRLRWSIRLPSPPGRGGDRWGDTHFADALAGALRRQGQDVVTRRRGAHQSGPVHLDDVTLALRGLFPIPPQPGSCNVLWIISHPDDVDPAELEGYDVVCAASTSWSKELSARTGRPVVPLLQATEFHVPDEPVGDAPAAAGVVFVGATNPRRDRRLVVDAVAAGIPLHVYGPGWDQLPEGIWRARHVDNHRLPELYHRYGVVLADHWPDMARHGFIANRVFDAVACGARVICDDVAGVHEVFDSRDVKVASSPQEVARALDELARTPYDSQIPRPPLAFDDRSRTLLELVVPLVRATRSG